MPYQTLGLLYLIHHPFPIHEPTFQMTDIPEAERPHIIATPQFWIVFFLYVFNAVADFAAYAFAPLSGIVLFRAIIMHFPPRTKNLFRVEYFSDIFILSQGIP